MTRDEIISMMLEAGIRQAAALRVWGRDGLTDTEQSDLEAVIRFAALVEERAAATEREACREIAFRMAHSDEDAVDVSHAIRERGEK